MTKNRKSAIGTLLLLCVLFYFAGTPMTASAHETMSGREAMLLEINAHRAAYGLPALRVSENLMRAAQIRAQEIDRSFSHVRPDGSPWYTVDYDRAYAESLGCGFADNAQGAQSIAQMWYASPSHHATLLYTQYPAIGIGVYTAADGLCFWAVEIGYD